MCFSAEASFSASAVLFVVGALSVSKVKENSQLPFVFIPLIFSVQQFMEGLLWVALKNPEHAEWQNSSTFVFLFFAQVVWTFWIPFSIFLLERDARRIKLLKILLGIGLVLSGFLAYRLLFYSVSARIVSHHIEYNIQFPYYWISYSGILYIIVTIVPMFLSSIRKMRTLGSLILFSFILARFFYYQYVISVWCFFAAVISIVIYSIAKELKRTSELHFVSNSDHQ